jgi:hypothetical protein
MTTYTSTSADMGMDVDVDPATDEYSSVAPEIHVGDIGSQPLLTTEVEGELLQRWTDVQAMFVDDPGQSVRAADALVRDINAAFQDAARERIEQLAGGWQENGGDTEALRLALQEYRSYLKVVLPR